MNINYQKVEIFLAKKNNELTIENARLQAVLDDVIQENKRLEAELSALQQTNKNENTEEN